MWSVNNLIKITRVTNNTVKKYSFLRNKLIVHQPLGDQKRCVCTTDISRCSNRVQELIFEIPKFRNSKRKEKIPPEPKKMPAKESVKPEKSTPKASRPVNNEQLLEKHIASLSRDLYQKNRVYKNDFLKVLEKVKELNFSSKKQGLLLLRCCTELLPDETPYSRMTLAEQVWNALKPHTKFTVEHYNQLLRVYIANNRTVNAQSFIQFMSPLTPNIETYELILTCLGEAGDINQATEVIANMKNNDIPATEIVFNSLIIGQGKTRNIEHIPEILSVMKSLRIEPSAATYTAVARSLAWNKRDKELLAQLDRAYRNGIRFEESHIMEIVKTLATISHYAPVPKVLQYLPQETLLKPSISPYMQSVTTELVFRNHPLIALEIYKCLPLPAFGPRDDQGLHGRSLVRDCVKAGVPTSVISLVTQELMATGRNPIAIHNAAEAALQLGKTPLAIDLFTRMKQMGMGLRMHYFWPILLHSSKVSGEKGLISTIETMLSLDVTPDYETMMNYILPYLSFTSPQNLMKKLLESGLTVSHVLTPMMETLANTGQLRATSELCELFEGKADAEKLMKPLVKGYLLSMDVQSLVCAMDNIKKKAADKSKDWVGRFLCTFVQQSRGNTVDFLEILKALQKANFKISASAADYCLNNTADPTEGEKTEQIRNILMDISDENIIDEGDFFATQMPHPKNMDEESLRAHLIELEAKGMNTRGVLRKLLQLYCRIGSLTDAKEILEKCQKEGVHLSAGMKAAVFDLHIKLGEVEQAELILADLTKTSPNFILDDYKIVDFAKALAFQGQFDRAIEVLTEHAKKKHVQGGRNISMNCWRVLDALASQGVQSKVQKMFETLVSLRYCMPTNVMLGPLIRVHLMKNDLQSAVHELVRIADEYKNTPLKHELLCQILIAMNDGQSEENFLANEKTNGMLNRMAQTVLGVVKKVHGSGDAQLTLIAALAEVGYKKTLRKILLDPVVAYHPDALLRRCERFAEERKVKPMMLLAECAKDIRHVEVAEIYEVILDVYQRGDNYVAAMEVWVKMQEDNITPTPKFIKTICEICKANNKEIPKELKMYIQKDPEDNEKEEVTNN